MSTTDRSQHNQLGERLPRRSSNGRSSALCGAVAQTSPSTTRLARATNCGKKKRDTEERAEAGGKPNPRRGNTPSHREDLDSPWETKSSSVCPKTFEVPLRSQATRHCCRREGRVFKRSPGIAAQVIAAIF